MAVISNFAAAEEGQVSCAQKALKGSLEAWIEFTMRQGADSHNLAADP